MSRLLTSGAVLLWGLVLVVPFPEKSCAQKNSSRTRAATAESPDRIKPERINNVQDGVWGGPHILMEVGQGGAKITYDCAHGTIDQKLVLDRDGRFDLQGTHVAEVGGPVRSDNKPDSRAARYTGRANGKTMTLTVTLTDTKEVVGTFSLTQGEQPELTRCA